MHPSAKLCKSLHHTSIVRASFAVTCATRRSVILNVNIDNVIPGHLRELCFLQGASQFGVSWIDKLHRLQSGFVSHSSREDNQLVWK